MLQSSYYNANKFDICATTTKPNTVELPLTPTITYNAAISSPPSLPPSPLIKNYGSEKPKNLVNHHQHSNLMTY